MDRRYQEFAERRCRDIKAFNHAVANDPEGEKNAANSHCNR